MADEGHKPTSGMKAAARRALEWRKEGHRGGTSIGLARANQIVNGESLSDDTVKRMFSFFSRHEVDKKAKGFNSGEEGYPSPGRVAWDLWGGDSGFAFARSKVKHTIKKELEGVIDKRIGGSSSTAHDPIEEPGHVEYYVRKDGGEQENMSEEIVEKSTTEPDPEGDIAVTKLTDSDLARKRINKAIKSLQKAADSIPDTSRASSVSVDNATAPVEKAEGLPDVSRPSEVSVANATAPTQKYLAKAMGSIAKAMRTLDSISKNVGNPNDLVGIGENSEPGNATMPAPSMEETTQVEKAACCADCGEDCTTEKQCCEKCMKMSKSDSEDVTQAEQITKAADEEAGESAEEEAAEDEEHEMEKTISKSVWGGAFAPLI